MAKKQAPPSDLLATPTASPAEYTVLARRYRPQQFADVIGQEPVARALGNALENNRVAHAYLFAGARGVGKTSMARILAKALNCLHGPTTTPCDQCDACRSIAVGEDVDVLEIDGASNRGIDEVREIRQNVQYRPARGRYKIYIIDEVHMLTTPAFNALLKTLEEPPAHVKFVFATTEATKIPVTILSRCQRFDFAGISSTKIVEHLRRVTEAEKREAEPEALEIVAHRAAGSMRDAQSLLDQLLAFGGKEGDSRLTAEQVQRLLGTANPDRLVQLATAMFAGDAKEALELLNRFLDEGLQLGELIDQLVDYWRDLMVVRCAGDEARELSVPSRLRETLSKHAAGRSLDTIMAGLDILAATKSRLRGSSQARVHVELALVRLSRMDDLMSLAEIANRLRGPGGAAGPTTSRPRENPAPRPRADLPRPPADGSPASRVLSETSTATPARAPAPVSPAQHSTVGTEQLPAAAPPKPGTVESLKQLWPEVVQQVGLMLGSQLQVAEIAAIIAPKTLVIRFPKEYNLEYEHCHEPTRVSRIEAALEKATGQVWNLRIEPVSNEAAASELAADNDNSTTRPRRQRTEAVQGPLVKRALERLGAQFVHWDEGFGTAPSESMVDKPASSEDEGS